MRNIFRAALKSKGFQTVISSLLCIFLGLFIGYIVLLCINPSGAWNGIMSIVKNFFNFSTGKAIMKNLGNTLAKTAPLIMCSLSITFCYKVGLFNIGAAGQYAVGAGCALYAALGFGWPWWLSMLFATLGGAVMGATVGVLKSLCNVNEVISGIMLNWISLYCVNMLLTGVKEDTSPYTVVVDRVNAGGIIPSLGINKLFSGNKYVTLALPIAVLAAIIVWVILQKTRLGYELKATGFNKNAARYCGMAERGNIILTLAIGGALAGMGASLLYLCGYEQWMCSASAVPAMGFNGISAAFLGGLNPIGTIFSSFFIQHITEGGALVDKTLYSSQISDLISAIIIYLCGFVLFIKYLMGKAVARREEKEITKGADAK